MSAYCGTSDNSGGSVGGFFRFVLFLIVVGILATVSIGALSHGTAKHKTDAELSRECMDKNGPSMTVVKPDNENRRVQLCALYDAAGNMIGTAIRVSEKINGEFQELTAYVDWNIKTINALISYAEVEAGTYGWIDFVCEVIKVGYVLFP